MPIKYESIVPWGRNFEEYCNIFNLTKQDLTKKIISCGDGPASFNYEGTQRGMHITSIDPIYNFTKEQLARRINETYDIVIKQTIDNVDKFVWKNFKNVEELGQTRMKAMKAFLEDYNKGLKEKRYIFGDLPHLEIEDAKYDIALSSHFLFLYSDNLSLDFHIRSIREMLRVSKEVRIFPVLDYNAKLSIHYEGVRENFEREGYIVECQATQYEFQKGGNRMLRIYKENEFSESKFSDNELSDSKFSDNQKIVCDLLDTLNMSYDLKFHPPAHSIEECEEIVHKLGEGVHCKNLFLSNRQETEFFLLLMRFDKKFKTSEVSKQIEKARLSFAKDEYLQKYLHVKPGSVSPMGLMFDLEHHVHLLIDKDLIEYEKIYFHPCDNTSSLLLKVRDFMNIFLPYTHHVPTLVEIGL